MIVWLRRSRVLRLLLVAFMVPLLVVVHTGGANAAGVRAASVKLTIDLPRGPDVRCGFVHSIDGDWWVVPAGSWCRQSGPPEWGNPMEAHDFEITVKGLDANDQPLQRTLDWPGAEFDDGWITNSVEFQEVATYVGEGFQSLEVCVKVTDDHGFDRSGESCVPSAVGTELNQCETGQVSKPTFGLAPALVTGARYQWAGTVEFQTKFDSGDYFVYAILGPDVPAPESTAGTFWGQADNFILGEHLGRPQALSGSGFVRTTPLQGQTRVESVQRAANGDRKTDEVITIQSWGARGLDNPQHVGEVIGFGAFKKDGLYQVYTPDVQSNGKLGVSDVASCSFYWGEKLYDDGVEGEGADEPLGPVDSPAPEMPDVPVDPQDDPWWTGLFDWLGDILRAILALPGRIADLILDGLAGLFIPSEGFLDDSVGELRDQADDSNIGEWNDAFSGLFSGGASGKAGAPAVGGESLTGRASATAQSAPSGLDFGGGGCQGPSIDISLIIPEGMGSEMETIHPFAACEGITAEMSFWSRLLSSLFLALFGGFKMFGYVASASFGMKQTEILRKFDWESDRLDGRSM